MSGRSKGRLASLWESVNSSLWFLPTVATASVVALFVLTYWLDTLVQGEISGIPVLISGDPDAVRSLLATISESLITVLAMTFSITIVALQLASSQYSPRLLRSFMADRGVQTVLAAYIATFVYAQLVLRVTGTSGRGTGGLNPAVSVTVAVILALVCIGLFIYYLQHVSNMIQSSTIVQKAQEDSVRTIAGLRDLDASGTGAGPDSLPEELARGEPLVVYAAKSGYVQRLDLDHFARAIAEDARGKVVAALVPAGPGHFVSAGLPLVRLWPAGSLGRDGERGVHEAFVFGKERSFEQDFAFGLRQLADIALKGLSPGVNDPTTAMQAMDRMEAILIALSSKALPDRVREREVGGVRVVVEVARYGYDDIVGVAFDQIRRAAFTSGQVAVLDRLLEILERLVSINESPYRRRALWARALTVARLAPSLLDDPRDAANLILRAVPVGAVLAGTALRGEVARDMEELAALSEGLPDDGRVREAVARALGWIG